MSCEKPKPAKRLGNPVTLNDLINYSLGLLVERNSAIGPSLVQGICGLNINDLKKLSKEQRIQASTDLGRVIVAQYKIADGSFLFIVVYALCMYAYVDLRQLAAFQKKNCNKTA